MSDLFVSLFLVALGLTFAVHCGRATVKEYQAGHAIGGDEWGNYDREESPLGFWAIIFCNAAASVMGLTFLVIGALSLLKNFGVAP